MEWNKSIVKIEAIIYKINLNYPIMNTDAIVGDTPSEMVSGTGFFISETEILTCYHVIKYATDHINIIYNIDNIKYEINSKIKYILPDDDLAVLVLSDNSEFKKHIKILDFEYVINKDFSTSVYAIGYPLDSDTAKITKGIVSGYEEALIQIDATLNPGNSGGPLVIKDDNEVYKVIGINVSKSSSDDAERTGYVVPIYRFKLLEKYINSNSKLVYNKPILHFEYQKLTQPDFLNSKTLKYESKVVTIPKTSRLGVKITMINKSYYLYSYLKEDDVIIGINSKSVTSYGKIKLDCYPMPILIEDLGLWYAPDDDITMYIIRNDEIKKIKFKLEIINRNLFDFYLLPSMPYYFVENNGFILSIFSSAHYENIRKLHLSLGQLMKITSRYLYQQDLFTVYLSNLNYSKIKHQFIDYPTGEIITEINGKTFTNYNEFINIFSNKDFKINTIKTIDNKLFFI
jgi:S1-C subfamily serine protease